MSSLEAYNRDEQRRCRQTVMSRRSALRALGIGLGRRRSLDALTAKASGHSTAHSVVLVSSRTHPNRVRYPRPYGPAHLQRIHLQGLWRWRSATAALPARSGDQGVGANNSGAARRHVGRADLQYRRKVPTGRHSTKKVTPKG